MTHTQGRGLLGTMALQQSPAHDNLQVLREGLKGPLLSAKGTSWAPSMTTQSLTRTETLMVSTGTLFLGSLHPMASSSRHSTQPDCRSLKVSTANCASASLSLSDSLICTHPTGGWTPDVASCLPPPDVCRRRPARVSPSLALYGAVSS